MPDYAVYTTFMRLRHVMVAIGLAALATMPAAPAVARPISPDADYLIAAHQGNLTQISTGRLAGTKATAPEVRALGVTLAAYHAKLDAEVRRSAQSLNVQLPAEPNSEQKALAEQYRAAPAARFDHLYLSTQVAAHDHALKLTDIVLSTGTDPGVRRLAAAASVAVQQHRDALAKAQQKVAAPQKRLG